MRIWIDTAGCDETFHDLDNEHGKWRVLHDDETECDHTEFGVEDTNP